MSDHVYDVLCVNVLILATYNLIKTKKTHVITLYVRPCI
jgi:hypothetical protein